MTSTRTIADNDTWLFQNPVQLSTLLSTPAMPNLPDNTAGFLNGTLSPTLSPTGDAQVMWNAFTNQLYRLPMWFKRFALKIFTTPISATQNATTPLTWVTPIQSSTDYYWWQSTISFPTSTQFLFQQTIAAAVSATNYYRLSGIWNSTTATGNTLNYININREPGTVLIVSIPITSASLTGTFGAVISLSPYPSGISMAVVNNNGSAIATFTTVLYIEAL